MYRLVVLFFLSGAILNAQDVSKGKEVFSVACSGCHATSHTTIQRKSADRWRRTIYTMISRGALVLPDEIEPLTSYLTATYGPSSPPPVLDASGPKAESLPPGSELVTRSCAVCHAATLVFNARKSESDWKATVQQMRAVGATLSDQEAGEIVAFLANHFGL